jgi:hypothetical protein
MTEAETEEVCPVKEDSINVSVFGRISIKFQAPMQ